MIVIVVYVMFIIIYGSFKKINCYDSFKNGVFDNFKILLEIFPNILALVFAVEVFTESGVLILLNNIMSNLKIPCEIIIQGLLKPISSSSSLIMMLKTFNNYGVDSKLGILSSIIQGCSDTTFYIITLYFSCVKIKDYKYALKAGLLTDIITFLIVIIFFSLFIL
jgi:spore maturation protein B